jgi:hypothetical protein
MYFAAMLLHVTPQAMQPKDNDPAHGKRRIAMRQNILAQRFGYTSEQHTSPSLCHLPAFAMRCARYA